MKKELNVQNSAIPAIIAGGKNSYDKIFNVFEQDDYYAYNIIKTVHFPADLDPLMTDYYRINGNMAWSHISFKIYGTIKLWWLICIVNKIMNPVIIPTPGLIVKIIKPAYLGTVMSQINSQI